MKTKKNEQLVVWKQINPSNRSFGAWDIPLLALREGKKDVRILSWNVNGLRAAVRKGFDAWLMACDADILGLQEVRAQAAQLDAPTRAPLGWYTHFVSAQRSGYSGVALYSRTLPDRIETSLGSDLWDKEGRLQIAYFGDLVVVNVYFPNGSGKDGDNSRVPYKLGFYQCLFERLETIQQGTEKIVVMGDFNTAHTEIDLARPRENQATSGFLPEERAEFQRWLDAGWIDTFREKNQDGGHYTWWSQRQQARARNIGWRIDCVLIRPALRPFLCDAFVLPDVHGSDHCPVGIELDIKTKAH